MSGPTGDVVWVDVLPSLDKFAPLLRAGLGASTGIAASSGTAAGGAFGKSFGDSAAVALDSASAKVGAANKRMADATGALNVQLAKLADLMDADNVSAGRLAAANEAVAKAQRNVQLTTEAQSTALKQQAVVTKDVANAGTVAAEKQAVLTKATNEQSLASKALTGTMGLATKALTVGFGAALIGLPFIAAIRDAQAFDRQMTLVQTQAGASAQEVRNLTPAILGLAGKTAQAPEELALSLYHVESTGIRGAAALNVVAAAARFATVSHANLEETTNALTSSVASGIPGFKNMNEAIGILNATVGSGDMKLSDLNEALGSGLLTIVKTYGLTMRDVAAALATFGDNNIRGALAATDLRLAVQALAVPSKQGRGELEKLGLSADTLAKDMQTGGLNKAIADLKDHLDRAGISTNQTGQILTEVFGKKAGPGLAILVSQFDRLQSKYAEVNRQASDFGAAWDRTTQTAAFAFQSLLDSMKAVAIIVGNAVLPILTKVATAVSSFFSGAITGTGTGGAVVQAFKNVADGVRQLYDFIKPLVDIVLLAFKLALEALVPVLSTLAGWYDQHKTLINTLIVFVGTFTAIIYAQIAAEKLWAIATGLVGTAIDLLKGAWLLLNILFAASPIGFILTALAALAAALVFAWENSKTFRDIVTGVLNALKTAFEVTVGWIVDHWQILVAAIPGVGPVLLGVIELITHFSQVWHTVLDGLKTAWDATWAALTGSFHASIGGLVTAWTAVSGGFVTAWNATTAVLASAWSTFWGGLKAVAEPIWNGIKAAWDGIGVAIKAVWDTVLSPVFNALIAVAKVIGIVLGVLILGPIALAWKGIQSVIHDVGVQVQADWAALQLAAQTMWQKVLQPIWIAMQVGWNALWVAMKTVYDTIIVPVWNALQVAARFMYDNVLAPTWIGIQVAWNALWTAMKAIYDTIIVPVWNALQAAARALWSVLTAGFTALKDALILVWTVMTQTLSAVFAAFRDLVVGIADNIWHWISDRFNAAKNDFVNIWTVMTTVIGQVFGHFRDVVVAVAQDIWNFVVDRFTRMKDAVVQIWSVLVSAVQTVWNAVEDVVSTPINFIIQVVFNKGLFTAWNWIVDTLGLPGNWHAPVWPQLPRGQHFAAGGQIDGPWQGATADNVPGWVPGMGPIRVNPREWIHPVSAVDYYGNDVMSAMQHKLIPRELFGGFAGGGQIPGFATGGQAFTWPQLWQTAQKMFPGVVLTSAYRPGAADYHGAGQAVDLGWAGNDYQHLFNIAAALVHAFPNSTELIHDPNASIKNGVQVPPGFWGTQTWLAHANHVHWAMTPDALAKGGAPGLQNVATAVFQSIGDVLNKLTGSISGPVGDFLGRFGGHQFGQLIGKVPGGLLGQMWNSVKGVVGQKVQAALAAAAAAAATVAGVGGGTPGQTNLAGVKGEAFQIAGQQFGWNSAQEQQALDYIATHESGWNPTAQNPVSSASGIWQLINATWQAYKNAGPWPIARAAPSGEQDAAAFRYIRGRYGDPIAAQQYWAVHHNYAQGGQVVPSFDGGGLWPSGSGGWNATGGIERVLTPQQDNYFRDFVDATNTGGGGGGQALINGGVQITMADSNPHQVMDELVYRLRVAGRGGVFSTVYGR